MNKKRMLITTVALSILLSGCNEKNMIKKTKTYYTKYKTTDDYNVYLENETNIVYSNNYGKLIKTKEQISKEDYIEKHNIDINALENNNLFRIEDNISTILKNQKEDELSIKYGYYVDELEYWSNVKPINFNGRIKKYKYIGYKLVEDNLGFIHIKQSDYTDDLTSIMNEYPYFDSYSKVYVIENINTNYIEKDIFNDDSMRVSKIKIKKGY